MSLNDIQLSGSVITDLFKNSLVLPGKIDKDEKNSPGTTQYKYLGNNLKKIILVVYSPGAVFLPEQQLLLLSKMLEACKLNIGDVAIINHFANPVNITDLTRQLSPKTILLFGLEPTAINLPFTIPAFKIQDYNSCRYLYTPSLDVLSQDTEEGKLLKSKLWLCLRNLFEV